MEQASLAPPPLPELAFYYPGPMWRLGDWVKNLLLFFDGIALLVPEYMRDRPALLDPAIAQGLHERGLLHIFEPEKLVDKEATEQLAMVMTNIITTGSLDELATEDTHFHELSYSRLGMRGDVGLARMIYEELEARGLARPSVDGVSIPMHPLVRALVLVLLAQILRPRGKPLGYEFCPVTDVPEIHSALQELLSLPNSPSAGRVVALDLQTVGVDLSAFPLDEVLRFRSEHQQEYRQYARDVRQFVRDLSALPQEEREAALSDRQEELKQVAQGLAKKAQQAWKRPTTVALGIAGAAWRLSRVTTSALQLWVVVQPSPPVTYSDRRKQAHIRTCSMLAAPLLE